MKVSALFEMLLSWDTELFRLVLRASLLGGCGLFITTLMRFFWGRRISPRARLALWAPAVLLLFMPPLPGWGIDFNASRDLNKLELGASELPEVPSMSGLEPAAMELPAIPLQPSMVLPEQSSLSFMSMAALAWFVIAILITTWCCAAHLLWWRRVRRTRSEAAPSLHAMFIKCCREIGLRHVPGIIVSLEIRNPAVAGLWRPCVIVPEGIEAALPAGALRHVLLHEAAHLRRRDLWWHWGSLAMLVIHWFNPLVWLAYRFLRGDREAACDALVLQALSGDGRRAYGSTLLLMQEELSHPSHLWFRMGVLGSADRLRQRILDISHHGKSSRCAGFAALATGLACAGMVGLFGGEPPKAGAPATATNATPADTAETPSYKIRFFCGGVSRKAPEAFVESQLAILKSSQLQKKAESRARTLHPELAGSPVTLEVARWRDSSFITVTATAPEAALAKYVLEMAADEMKALSNVEDAAQAEKVKESPEFKSLSAQETELVRLVEEQKVAEDTGAPAATVEHIKARLEDGRQRYQQNKLMLEIRVPTYHLVLFEGPLAVPRTASGLPAQPSRTTSGPDSIAPLPEGQAVSRAQIDVLPEAPSRDPSASPSFDKRSLDEIVGTQMETLKSALLHERAEARTRMLHPDITPVPVTLTVSRVPDTGKIDLKASGGSASYVQWFLESVLQEMAALRNEQIDKSMAGTLAKAIEEVRRRQEAINDLAKKLASSTPGSPQAKEDVLNALELARGDLRDWLRKTEQLRSSGYVPISVFKVLQPAAPTAKAASDPKVAVQSLSSLALSYLNMDDYEKAAEAFREVLRNDPGNDAARRGMERAEQRRTEEFDIARAAARAKMYKALGPGWQPPKSDTAGAYYTEKMRKIIFPKVQFTSATVEEAVEFLRIKSRDYDDVEGDAARRGVNLIVQPGHPPATKRITLDLANVTMAEALQRITELGGMRYKTENYAVVVFPADTSGELFTRTFKVLPGFLSSAAGGAGEKTMTALDVLKARSISFPEGATASFVPATSQLIVRNTSANLEKVQALVEELAKKGAKVER